MLPWLKQLKSELPLTSKGFTCSDQRHHQDRNKRVYRTSYPNDRAITVIKKAKKASNFLRPDIKNNQMITQQA